jgi:hypothetical protein
VYKNTMPDWNYFASIKIVNKKPKYEKTKIKLPLDNLSCQAGVLFFSYPENKRR